MPEVVTRREQARRDMAAARDPRWSTSTVAGFTTRSRVDDTREGRRMPPPWVLDRIAEAQFWQGYQDRPTCPTCFMRLPVTGTCFCGGE